MMSVMKAASARRAEKALREILDKADDDANGRVRLTDFIAILEANDVKVGGAGLKI
jgi:Ca2+-binding EF-hand superfamily protein